MNYARATIDDKEKIAQFLSQFVNETVFKNLDHYLTRRVGGLFLAIDDHQDLIGIASLTSSNNMDVVISGLRISPPHQNASVVGEFGEFLLNESRMLGARKVRFLVSRDNQVMQNVWSQSLGFVVQKGWVMGAIEEFDAQEYVPEMAGPAWSVDRDRVEKLWEELEPPQLWSHHDLLSPQALTMDDVWQRFEDGGAALAPQHTSDDVDTIVLYSVQHNEAIDIQYIHPGAKFLHSVLEFLWIEARAWGLQKLRFGVEQTTFEQLAKAVGDKIKPEWSGVIMEKRLDSLKNVHDEG